MSQAISEFFAFLVESFQTYSGNNLIWLLYPLALIIILILGKKGDRMIFLTVLGVEMLTIFNPIFMELATRLFSFENRYLRFFWMVLFFITIAYAMVILVFHFKNLFVRSGLFILCLALILLLGNPVFFGQDAPPYEAAENDQFIESELLELSAILHSEGIERPRVLYGGLMLVYRQYDPTVISILTHDSYRYLQSHSHEEFMAGNKFKKRIHTMYQVFYYQDFTVEPQRFLKSVQKCKADYLVSNSESLDTYLAPLNLTLLSQTEHYRIWKIPE